MDYWLTSLIPFGKVFDGTINNTNINQTGNMNTVDEQTDVFNSYF